MQINARRNVIDEQINQERGPDDDCTGTGCICSVANLEMRLAGIVCSREVAMIKVFIGGITVRYNVE